MSAAVAAAAAAACRSSRNNSGSSIHRTAQNDHHEYPIAGHRRRPPVVLSILGSRYESRKRKEWISFMEFMREKRPGLAVSACSGGDVVEFLKHYLYGDGQNNNNNNNVPQQRVYWGSVEAIIGRLRVAFEEMGGQALAPTTTTNPFNAPEVRFYLRQLEDAHLQQHHHHQQQQQLNSNFNNVFLYHNYL